MLTGHIKAGVFVVFAIMVGVVQLMCACMPQSNNSNHMNSHMSMSSMKSEHVRMDYEAKAVSQMDSRQHDHDQPSNVVSTVAPCHNTGMDDSEEKDKPSKSSCPSCDDCVFVAASTLEPTPAISVAGFELQNIPVNVQPRILPSQRFVQTTGPPTSPVIYRHTLITLKQRLTI